jgi:hypothetical protein
MPIIDPNINQTVQRVHMELAGYLANNGLDLKGLEILNVIQRPFSIIIFLLARTSAGNQRVVMKKVVHDPINIMITKRQNQAVVEYELLQHLYPKFQEIEGCAVPRPILVIPEIEAFLMEFVEGRLLSEELCHARYWADKSGFRKLQKHYYLCGKWLRHFQEFTGIEMVGAAAFDGLVERCELRLKLIEEVRDSRCPKGLGNRIMDLLQKQLSYLKDGEVMIAGRHGDFGHWNAMVDQNGITVLDFLGFAKEAIVYDILKILISLEFWKNHLVYSNDRLEALRRNLLEGLGGFPAVPLPVVTICEIYHRVSTIYACLSNRGDRWDKRQMRHRALQKNLKAFNHLCDGNVIWPGPVTP